MPERFDAEGFFQTRLRDVHARALMSYPPILEDESEGVRVLSKLVANLRSPIRVRHPHVDLELALPALLGPRMIYLNGGSVDFIEGCVGASTTSGTVPFFVADEPWFSTLFEESQPDAPKRKIEVPAVDFSTILFEKKPSVLFVDIEGAERHLFDAPLPSRPRLIMIEIHHPLLGSIEATRVVSKIVDHGYRGVDLHGWTYVFERRD